jgi:hypothetical protein
LISLLPIGGQWQFAFRLEEQPLTSISIKITGDKILMRIGNKDTSKKKQGIRISFKTLQHNPVYSGLINTTKRGRRPLLFNI